MADSSLSHRRARLFKHIRACIEKKDDSEHPPQHPDHKRAIYDNDQFICVCLNPSGVTGPFVLYSNFTATQVAGVLRAINEESKNERLQEELAKAERAVRKDKEAAAGARADCDTTWCVLTYLLTWGAAECC